MDRLSASVDFAMNPNARCPCILLLDTSYSMSGDPIAALNEGLKAFESDLQEDDLAKRRVEIAIVTFGNGGVQVAQDFVTADRFRAPTLPADGDTPMGSAIDVALNLLRQRKREYQDHGHAYYRPWIFMITDGAPTDTWQAAAKRLHAEVKANGLSFFAVGVDSADMGTLAQIASPDRAPVRLSGHKFREMFLWLSRSQRRASQNNPNSGEQIPLDPLGGWGSVQI